MEKIKSKKITGRTCYTPAKTAHCSKINFNNRTSQAEHRATLHQKSQSTAIYQKEK